MKQHVPLFFEIAKLLCVKFSDTLGHDIQQEKKICVWVEAFQNYKQIKTRSFKGKYQVSLDT